jgi:formylglycine-generating enzyme required for sulfatase activity
MHMRKRLACILSFTLSLIPLVAQEVTNAPAPATTLVNTNKPDIKELIKEPSFTNATGMVMIKISESLWVGKYEVTQAEYQKIAGANPSKFGGGDRPVDSVSWNEARDFCARLTSAEKAEDLLPEGFAYSFPTEAQWELLVGDAQLKDAVTSEKKSAGGTTSVGSLGANNYGLYDIRGNVWEFCSEPQDQVYRVLRGAAWNTSYEPQLRSEFRWYADGPDDRKEFYGFRATLVPGK